MRFSSFAAGAFGALPFVAMARTAAATLYRVPSLPGAERMMSDVKQATYFEAATLLTVIPAAALLFGRIVPAALEKRGVPFGRAHFPSIGFGTSVLFWRSGLSPGAAVCLGLIVSAVILAGPILRGSHIAVLAGLLLLFLGGLALYYRPANRLDLFEDGQILFGASALSNGARPYLDVYPVHGWGADGGWVTLFSRGARNSLENFRLLRAVATALAVACLGAAAWLFFADGAWAMAGLVASLCFCPFLSERHMPALLALAVLIAAARSPSLGPWLWAGVFSAMTLFSTLDFGVIFLLGGTAAPLALKILAGDPARKALGRTIGFGTGALLGAAPFLFLLARRGALEEFFRVSCVEIPSSITATWGVPAVSLTKLLRETSLVETYGLLLGSRDSRGLLTLLLVLASSAFVLLLRSRERVFDPSDRAATVCLLAAILGLRGVLGRADFGHRMMYGVLAGLPAAWLLYRISRVRAPRIRLAAGVLAAAGSCLLLRPDRVVTWQIQSLGNAAALRRTEERGAALVPGHEPSRLPREQVLELEELRSVLDAGILPDRTFFDFGNEPGLYFLLRRKPPTRYSSVPCYETQEKQLEVIQALERERPPIAIIASGRNDAFDGVSNRDRAPLVARYLDEHYRTIGRVGSRTLAALIARGERTRSSRTHTASR
ncbi:MAG: hypothetical protein LC796_09885 [Acidobacteria bacterium]|nr:hypothetical protein [Acidobacteriota bacterium]MCA1610497.1 hypothetical protein [Acidobacteriota bacterium]